MARVGPTIAENIKKHITIISSAIGVAYFTLIIVSREAIETVLLVAPFLSRNLVLVATGVLAGAISAIALAYIFYVAGRKISLRLFFYYTSLLLVFIASGLVGYSVHELLEWARDRGYTGILLVQVYDLDLPEFHFLSNEGWIGSLLSVLAGYSDEMKFGRLVAQLLYLLSSLVVVIRAYK